MPENHVIYGFTAGEVAPEYYARTDLTKYNLGASFAKNFFVDYKGGMSTRGGSSMLNQVLDDSSETKLVRFRGTGDDYVLIFENLTMRVVRTGGLILESALLITGATQADPAVITVAAHGYTTGDWGFIEDIEGMTELNDQFYKVVVLTPSTFSLTDINDNAIDSTAFTAYTSAGTFSRVFTLTTPYVSADLAKLKAEQRLGKLTLTHNNYKRRELVYVADDDWTLDLITTGATIDAPTNLSTTPSAAGSAGVIYAVTAISTDDSESLPSPYEYATSIVNFTETAGSVRINWDAVSGASHYFIYRSTVLPDDADLSQAMEVGFLGRALGPQFTDNNITPDFTKLPPVGTDPFADDSITLIEVTAGGSGYDNASTVTITGPGSGFVGYPIVGSSGAIIAVSIVNGGSGYTAPVVVFAGSGSLATGTATTSESTGNDPGISKIFQQRNVYAGTENFPMTIDGSKPGDYENFDTSTVVTSGDAYTFTFDQQSVTPVKHLVALRSGLLAFTDSSIEQIRAEEGQAVTPLNALAETQAYKGASDVSPITIELDILFTQQILGSLFAMSFTQYTNSYALQDLSILSSHLFGKGKSIVNMTYAAEPHKLVYCTREDGTRLLFTYLREQEVFAWTQDETKGYYKDCVAIVEDGESVLYQIVERTLAGGTHKYIERVSSRTFELAEDYWGVDCGLQYLMRTPAATCTPSAATGTGVSFTFDADISADIVLSDIIYIGGGKAQVTQVPSPTEVICTFIRDIADVQPEDASNLPTPQVAGDWEVSTPTLTVGGLAHLEGETVSVLADGNAFTDKVVTDGEITLDTAATKIIIGLQYTAQLRTLSVTTNQVLVDGRFKDVLAMAVRVNDTRGLTVGSSFAEPAQHAFGDRTDEDWGEQIKLRSDMSTRFINHEWDKDGYIYFQQAWPLPASVLGYVLSVELGEL